MRVIRGRLKRCKKDVSDGLLPLCKIIWHNGETFIRLCFSNAK